MNRLIGIVNVRVLLVLLFAVMVCLVLPSHSCAQIALQGQTLDVESPPEESTRNHLVEAALIVGAVVAILFVMFTYLQLDRASRSFYSRRLLMLSLLAVIGIVAICIWLFTVWVS